MEKIIDVQNLRKAYKKETAVSYIDFMYYWIIRRVNNMAM